MQIQKLSYREKVKTLKCMQRLFSDLFTVDMLNGVVRKHKVLGLDQVGAGGLLVQLVRLVLMCEVSPSFMRHYPFELLLVANTSIDMYQLVAILSHIYHVTGVIPEPVTQLVNMSHGRVRKLVLSVDHGELVCRFEAHVKQDDKRALRKIRIPLNDHDVKALLVQYLGQYGVGYNDLPGRDLIDKRLKYMSIHNVITDHSQIDQLARLVVEDLIIANLVNLDLVLDYFSVSQGYVLKE